VRVRFSNREICIPDGALAAITGPGGRHLLRLIAGLPTPYAGKPIIEPGAHGRPETALAPAPPALLPWLTVEENIRYGLRMRRRPVEQQRDAARHFARLLGITGYLTAWPDQVPERVRRRASIARALTADPQILLCDQPRVVLDAAVWLSVCQAARARGQTLVYTDNGTGGLLPACDCYIQL